MKIEISADSEFRLLACAQLLKQASTMDPLPQSDVIFAVEAELALVRGEIYQFQTEPSEEVAASVPAEPPPFDPAPEPDSQPAHEPSDSVFDKAKKLFKIS